MRKEILLIIVLLFIFKVADSLSLNRLNQIDTVTITFNKWNNFIQRIIEYETSQSKGLIGDNGLAIGVLQIHPIIVDEVNRISKKQFMYLDRWDKDKSIEIFNIYQDYYNPQHDLELAGRLWNAGRKALNVNNDYLTDDYIKKLKL